MIERERETVRGKVSELQKWKKPKCDREWKLHFYSYKLKWISKNFWHQQQQRPTVKELAPTEPTDKLLVNCVLPIVSVYPGW